MRHLLIDEIRQGRTTAEPADHGSDHDPWEPPTLRDLEQWTPLGVSTDPINFTFTAGCEPTEEPPQAINLTNESRTMVTGLSGVVTLRAAFEQVAAAFGIHFDTAVQDMSRRYVVGGEDTPLQSVAVQPMPTDWPRRAGHVEAVRRRWRGRTSSRPPTSSGRPNQQSPAYLEWQAEYEFTQPWDEYGLATRHAMHFRGPTEESFIRENPWDEPFGWLLADPPSPPRKSSTLDVIDAALDSHDAIVKYGRRNSHAQI